MKYGIHLALLGPDGCGKSTVIPLLSERLKGDFSSITISHWRPKVLQDPGVASGRREQTDGPVTDPHGKPPHGLVLGLVRLFYYLLDYWLGFFGIQRAKREGKLVLFDRYAPDIWIDPRRYRFGLPQGVLRMLCRFTPSPDIGFVLLADVVLLYERKREVPLEVLHGLIENYRLLTVSDPTYRLIDCSRTPEEVADAIAAAVIDFRQNYKR